MLCLRRMTSIERKKRRRKDDLLMLCLRRMTSMRKYRMEKDKKKKV